jgi:hypothetical protein
MLRIIFGSALTAGLALSIGGASGGAAQALRPDLSTIASGRGWTVVRRAAQSFAEADRSGVRLDAREGDGIAWLDGSDFDNGVIELDLKGKNVPQQSFLGVAFRGVDDTSYDTVYFRPFNFAAADPARRAHAVQYDSRPDHHWPRLREEHPGVYESAIEPPPDPEAWFHVRIEVDRPEVRVYVNGAQTPCLTVKELSGRAGGRVGLWVGNNSDGAFANLTMTGRTGERLLDLSGPYLGQTPPGATPELFAPGLVSTGGFERDVAMSPDGNTIYFGVSGPGYVYTTVLVTRLVDGRWTEPAVVPHLDDPRYLNLEPALSPDGRRFYFLSTRPAAAGAPPNQDIWVMTGSPGGWSEPENLGAPVNTDFAEYFPSITRDGTIYFTRQEGGARTSNIWRARFAAGRYLEPEKLPAQVNSGQSHYNAFIAPDESYLIVPVDGRDDSIGGGDYYVVFRTPDDRWSDPINLGPDINSEGSQEFSPYVSPDGKYFFFMATRLDRPERLSYSLIRGLHDRPRNGNADIYWVAASVVTSLRSKAVFR